MRDDVVDYVRAKSARTELPAKQLVKWLGIGMSKFYEWRNRHGKVNEHAALVPRDHWLEAWEKAAIVAFHAAHPLEGYRRLTYTSNRCLRGSPWSNRIAEMSCTTSCTFAASAVSW